MSASRRIAGSWIKQQPKRVGLIALTMAIAISLVIFTLAGTQNASSSAEQTARSLLGPYDIVLRPRIALQPELHPDFLAAVDTDARSQEILATQVAWGNIQDVENTTYYDSWRTAFLGSDRTEPVGTLRDGRWFTASSPSASGAIEGVIDGGLASTWRVNIGDRLPLDANGGSMELEVVGITEAAVSSNRVAGVWVSNANIKRIAGGTPPGLRWYVKLTNSELAPKAAKDWAEMGDSSTPPANVVTVESLVGELSNAGIGKRLKRFGWAAAILALCAAGFMIHSAIAGATAQRRKDLATLRCIGATRGQIMTAVIWEALLISAIALPIGVLLGTLWLVVLGLLSGDYFASIPLPTISSLIVGVAAASITALGASLGPAYKASQDDPVKALAQSQSPAPSARQFPIIRGSIAFLLVIFSALLTDIAQEMSVAGAGFILLSQIMLLGLAAFLGTSVAIYLAELFLIPILAKISRLPPSLIRQQASARPEFNHGIVRTLALCLGMSILMNVWGRSMVTPFLPSPDLPAGVASLMPAGIPYAGQKDLNNLPGVLAQGALPVAVEQTLLAPSLFAKVGGKVEDATVLILGIDPNAFTVDDPLLPLVFDDGSPQEARNLLLETGSVLIPQDLLTRLELSTGDKLSLMALGNAAATNHLKVVGKAALPGWHWVTKFANMRTLGEKPLAPIIVSLETAQSLGIKRLRHIFLDLTDDADYATLREHLSTIAQTHIGPYESGHYGPAFSDDVTVKLTDTRRVANLMRERSDSVIWVLGALPLGALLVAVLGIAAASSSAVRARSREFGVLRGMGMSGDHCGRLVLCESIILSFSAFILCLSMAIIAANAAIGIGLAAWGAGGTRPPLIIPWFDIALAALITGLAAISATYMSAKRLAQIDPTELLAAKDSSMT